MTRVLFNYGRGGWLFIRRVAVNREDLIKTEAATTEKLTPFRAQIPDSITHLTGPLSLSPTSNRHAFFFSSKHNNFQHEFSQRF
jgi:hypothetical protein